jgi:hypothetical protein
MYFTLTALINTLYVLSNVVITVLSGSSLGRAGGCASGIQLQLVFSFDRPQSPLAGLWAPFMALLTIQTRRSSQDSMSFWGMCNIPTKWYPLFLVALFSLLGSDPISLLAGVVVGYCYESGRCSALQLSDARLQAWDVRLQASPTFASLYYAPGFVPHVSAQLATALPVAFAPRQQQQQQEASASPSSGGFMDNFRVRGAAPAPSAGGGARDPFAGHGHSLR